MSWKTDIRVIVGLDFGTTNSGFSLVYYTGEDIGDVRTNCEWPGGLGTLKTNTVLQYKDGSVNVESWGYPALCKKPNTKKKNNETRPVELFKLYLGNCLEKHRPKLPVDYKKAIADYLCELGKLIKKTIPEFWPGINFMNNVLLVLTVPAEFKENDKAIMRECAYQAELINDKYSEKLQFTTEPEAAAIYCMYSSLKEHGLTKPGTNFMVVDCGGGTVDLTTRELLEENQLGEVTERAGDFCGSTFIDKKYIELLKRELGNSAIESFSDEHYGQLQYLVQDFCQKAKLKFTGDDPSFNYEVDLEEIAPALLQYVTGSERDLMEDKGWLIKFDFNSMKSMFDPIIDRIIEMIHVQLKNSEKCSAIFLVGGFGQSKYLQKRIEEEFSDFVKYITTPSQPIAAVVRGAAIYGKSLYESRNLRSMNNLKCVIATRVLNYTFGIKVSPLWEYGDPLDLLTSDRRINKFRCMAEHGTKVTIDQEFAVEDLIPIEPDQSRMSFEIYYTKEDSDNVLYCDEPSTELKLLGNLLIDLPDVHLGIQRPCTFCLSFGDMEIKARAFNQINGQNYETKFELSDF